MAWVGKDHKDRVVPAPCPGQGCLPPAQAAQGSMQPGLKRFQEWGILSFSGQSVPLPRSKELHIVSSYVGLLITKPLVRTKILAFSFLFNAFSALIYLRYIFQVCVCPCCDFRHLEHVFIVLLFSGGSAGGRGVTLVREDI